MDNLPGSWCYEYLTPKLVQAVSMRRVLYSGKTAYQSVDVVDTDPFGRCLLLDGKIQSSEIDEFVYHEALVHLPMTLHPCPEHVLIAGGGEGATLREVLIHRSVRHATMVDLDEEVVNLCRKYLPSHHQGAFDDQRLKLYYEDAQAFLERQHQSYDVAILDVPDPIESGPAFLLYTQEFFSLVLSRLNDHGVMVVQAGSCGPISYTEAFTAIHKTVASVFTHAVPYRVYVPSFGAMWGFVVGSMRQSPLEMTHGEIDRRLAERLERPLRYYDGVAHSGMLALPKYIRQGLCDEQRIITRDKPVFVF